MSNTINIANFNRPNLIAQTQLTQDIAASASSLPVGNSASFSAGGYVLIGDVGSSSAELRTATTPSTSTAIPLSASTALAHNFDDVVTLLFGNQLNIYRADDVAGNGTQPPDANFTKIDTINIVANSSLTAYTDAAGVLGQWYKFTYHNQAANTETALAESRAVQPGQIHLISLDQVRDAAGFTHNPNVTDDIVAEKRDAAEREVLGALQAVYVLPLPQPTNPLVVRILKDIAGGELMAEMYTGVSADKVAEGEAKAAKGRTGNMEDNSDGLAQLVDRSVVLQDANYIELTIDEAHGFGGWPDETTQDTSGTMSESQRIQGGFDRGFHFTVDKEY